MKSLYDYKIQTKLMTLAMMAVVTALSFACALFAVNDVRLIRADMVQQLSALADILGANTSAALTFDDSEAAEQLLASLEMQPYVTRAFLFTPDNEVFATYLLDGEDSTVPEFTLSDGHRYAKSRLQVVKQIVVNGDHIGTIYVEGHLGFVRRQLMLNGSIVLATMFVSCAAAYMLTSRLQHIISQPILTLTRAAQAISRSGDYSVRVQLPGNDELGVLTEKFNDMLDKIETNQKALEDAHNELEQRVRDRTRQLSEINEELNNEINERVRAEQELEKVHREFLDAARRAGMAEIATGVLHNVGNVLNSVNVSASMLNNRLNSSKTPQVGQIAQLLEQHSSDIGDFMANNEKGKQIPRFLAVLYEHLASDEKALLEEAQSLITNVDHIKTIISTQQSYAKSGGMVEPIDVNSLLEDAVKLHASSFGKHHIKLIKDYGDLPDVLLDKQRLMQIVINLVKNAKEALRDCENCHDRTLTIRTRAENGRLLIEISDTGIGISERMLTQIFSHGFTTKRSGHGFGLHSCANAATEMKGKLTASSDGLNKGATFTLDLPLREASVKAV